MNHLTKIGLAALAAVPFLTACGGSQPDANPVISQTGPTPAASSTPATPACASVWVEGKVLPADYTGCQNGDTLEAATASSCGLVVYGKAWAKLGQPIRVARTTELAADPAYKAAFC